VWDDKSGWSARWEGQGFDLNAIKIRVPVKTVFGPPASDADMYQKRVEEFQWRINRSPKEPINYQALISLQVKNKDYEGALSTLTAMHQHELKPWWELQVLVRVLHQLGQDNWAEREMIERLQNEGGFIQYCFLIDFYYETQQLNKIDEYLLKAIEAPFIEVKGTGITDNSFLHMLARYAFALNQFDLAIKFCDKWEQFDNETGWSKSEDLYVLRAAAALKLGNTESAKKDQAMAKMVCDERYWCKYIVDRLGRALESQGSHFKSDLNLTDSLDIDYYMINYNY
jgi:hypothetical protein